MTSPDDRLRAMYAARREGDRGALDLITGRHRGGQDAETGAGEMLPDAEAVASMEGDEQNAN